MNVSRNLDFRPGKFLELESDEAMKNLGSVELICQWLAQEGASKDSRLIAVGGGVIQDLVTISASLFMRGVAWEFIPSTTNAMVDSCVGGKSAINTATQKNLIGNFFPPEAVYLDLSLLQTLGTKDYLGGIFEAVKIIFAVRPIDIPKFAQELSENDYVLTQALVTKVLKCKIEVIEEDEFDAGRRLLLNYGHTFGHALERASDYKISHGLAVGIGMLAANALDRNRSDLILSLEKTVFQILGQFPHDCLPDPRNVDWEAFSTAFESDKKHTHMAYRVVVPENDALRLLSVPRSKENLDRLVGLMRSKYFEVFQSRLVALARILD